MHTICKRLVLAACLALPGIIGGAAHCRQGEVSTLPVLGQAHSRWVYRGEDGKLVYATTPRGDRILDFSHAGYMGGGVALPEVPVVITVKPSGSPGDTKRLQEAINDVSAMPLRGEFRGAVFLAPGRFICSATLELPVSGVVVRGSGSGAGGTTIVMRGEKHCAFVIGRKPQSETASRNRLPGAERRSRDVPMEQHTAQTSFMDRYVPSGATVFSVASIDGFAVGDTILIKRPTTPAWLRLLGMDDLKRDGRPQTFLAVGRAGDVERRITAISGTRITVDVPLSDSYDARYLDPPGTTVRKEVKASGISHVGIERLRIECPALEIKYSDAPYSAVRCDGDDCWIRDVRCEETMNTMDVRGKRVTLQEVVVTHTYPNLGASKPADFSIAGCQILIDRCGASGGNTYFVWTGSLGAGPNVVLNSSFTGHGSRLQPHQRWATGLLIDNCRIPQGGIDYMNRGAAGSGHGWTMGWGVVWNCVASTYILQNPPGACNWAIGCVGMRKQQARLFDTGPILPDAEFDSFGTHVSPRSLYLAQLEERLGPQALKNIGYAPYSSEELQGPQLPLEPALRYDVDPELGKDLAMYRPVNVSNIRESARTYGGEKAVDGNLETYWATDDGLPSATFEADTEGPLDITAVEICEATGFEGRVRAYTIEGYIDSQWKLLSEGTAIGTCRRDHFPKATVWKVRLTVRTADEYAAIKKFSLYAK